SKEPDVIAQRVLKEMDRGVTRLGAYGGYTGEPRTILYIVVSRPEVALLKDIVYRSDSKAFVVVATVHEVLGEGFHQPRLED
ncbi:MAG: YitT family protein, partial [Firmicutes bacterium]|nr:YitT family protein [Bacillota bacterium]